MQIGRTILLQEVDSDGIDLLTLIGETRKQESLDDKTVFEIRDKLVIGSIDEFWKKFQSCLYRYLDTEHYTVEYKTKNDFSDQEKTEKIVFDEKYWLIEFTYFLLERRQKMRSFQNPFLQLWSFRYNGEKLAELKTIRAKWKNIWFMRKQGLLCEYEEEIFPKIIRDFDDGTFLLFFYINEKKDNQKNSFAKETKNVVFECPDYYEVEYIGCVGEETRERVFDTEQAKSWQKYLRTRLSELPIRNLTLLSECLRGDTYDNISELERQLNIYERYAEFYQQVVQAYWDSVQPILTRFLNIYFFFKQAGENNDVSLLITNCTEEKISEPKYLERLRLYLESVNEKVYGEETVWQAIIPGRKPEVKKGKLTRERFAGTSQKAEKQSNDAKDIGMLMNVLGSYEVQTFVSMEGGEITFQSMQGGDCEKLEEGFARFLNDEWAQFICPCYPNFTIIPKEQGAYRVAEHVYLDEQLQFAHTEQRSRKIFFPGLYVEASYVAAGVFARYGGEDEFADDTIMPKEYLGLEEQFLEELEKNASGITFTFSNELGKRNFAKILTQRTLAFRWDNPVTVRERKEKIIGRRKQRH